MIGQAMQKMSTDTGGCIQFQQLISLPLPSPGSMKFVTMSKAGGAGFVLIFLQSFEGFSRIFFPISLLHRLPSPTCYSFPGMVTSQNGQGQQMSLQGGQSGCMNSPRHIMRMLASLTGLRSEHNKPNR